MYYLGLDLGKRQDHSAVAVVERLDAARGYGRERDGHMVVRYLERIPLGTRYPAVVEHVCQLAYRLRHVVRHPGSCALVVDATGVGEPVVDMVRASLRQAGPGYEVIAVTITGGTKETGSISGLTPAMGVPKVDLIAGVQLMLENEELRISGRLCEAGALAKELVDMKVSGGMRGKVRIGADGSGEHDDLVIALALAVWRAKKMRLKAGFVGGRLPGI